MKVFTYRELVIILACLRRLQDEIRGSGTENLTGKYPYFNSIEPPSSEEIDALCEVIYSGNASIAESGQPS